MKPSDIKANFQLPIEQSTYSLASRHSASLTGRNLFSNPEKEKMPGPGYYEEPMRRTMSFCYIKKEENHLLGKVEKKLRRRQIINECRGPGLYNPENAFNYSSKSLAAKQGKIPNGNFTRTILPEQISKNIHLASSLSQKIVNLRKIPGPDTYDIQKLGFKTSNYFNNASHKMSITQRSSIAKQSSRMC